VRAQHKRAMEPQLVVGAEYTSMIAVDVEAFVDRDACGVGSASTTPDDDICPFAAKDSGRGGQYQRTVCLGAGTQEDLDIAGLQRERDVY